MNTMHLKARPFLAALALVLTGAAAASAQGFRDAGGRVVPLKLERSHWVTEPRTAFTMVRPTFERSVRERPTREQTKPEAFRLTTIRPERMQMVGVNRLPPTQADEYFPHGHIEGNYPRVPTVALNNPGYRTGQGSMNNSFNATRANSGGHGGKASRYHASNAGFAGGSGSFSQGRRQHAQRLDRGGDSY